MSAFPLKADISISMNTLLNRLKAVNMIRRYKKQMSDQTIWAHKSWQPYVIGRGKDLIYIFHIESGAIGLAFEAPITKGDILVIKRAILNVGFTYMLRYMTLFN